ncbi:MAG: hypothetical protein JOZ05_22495, partial [Acetobacteraceae bacterium]|nr:hypothetical protein [Acetobacteraceae bacterium]
MNDAVGRMQGRKALVAMASLALAVAASAGGSRAQQLAPPAVTPTPAPAPVQPTAPALPASNMGDPAAIPMLAGRVLDGTWTSTQDWRQTFPEPPGPTGFRLNYRAITPDSIVVRWGGNLLLFDFDDPPEGLPAEVVFMLQTASPDRSILTYRSVTPLVQLTATFQARVDPGTTSVAPPDETTPGVPDITL